MKLGDVQRQALELATRVAAYPEVEMRRAALGEWLNRVPPDTAAPWLAEIVRRGREGGPPFDRALAALVTLFERPAPLTYEGMAAIYKAARNEGLAELADLFLSRGQPAGGDEAKGRIIESQDGRPLTLGERKSLARRSTREQIIALARDPDPSVLRQLLLNPKLTERDVVLIAARRPTSAAAQKLVADSRRFSSSYAVRRALVLNPYTPVALATRLLPLMRRSDLRSIAREPTLDRNLCDLASRLARSRDARSDGDS